MYNHHHTVFVQYEVHLELLDFPSDDGNALLQLLLFVEYCVGPGDTNQVEQYHLKVIKYHTF